MFAAEMGQYVVPNGTVWTTSGYDGAVTELPPGAWEMPMSFTGKEALKNGYPSMPDPKPNPPPTHSSQYDTLYGEGDYWIGIPNSINAHSPAFIQALHACHAGP